VNAINKTRSSGGFTIAELMVVLAIVILLMVLLIPAINSVRESSRAAKCSVHQNRLALAITKFDARNGSIPSWRHSLTLPSGGRFVPFVFPVMPFFDQIDVFNAYTTGSAVPPSAFEIDTLVCPALGTAGGYNPGRGDYGANFGSGHGTNWLANPEGQTSSSWRPFKDDGALADGASSQTQSMAGIAAADGISMTLLTSEIPRNFWLPGSANCFGGTVYQSQFGGCMVFGHAAPAPSPVPPRVINNASLGFSPRSLHVNGVNASFADGSTRFLTNALAPHVYAHILTSRSVFSSSSPVTYGNNSRTANFYLRAPPAPAASAFVVKEQDLK